jgi:hypothetical protein
MISFQTGHNMTVLLLACISIYVRRVKCAKSLPDWNKPVACKLLSTDLVSTDTSYCTCDFGLPRKWHIWINNVGIKFCFQLQKHSIESWKMLKADFGEQKNMKSMILRVRSNSKVAGLWSWYIKPPTLTPQFLNLRLLHKSSICTNNGKPTKMVNGIIFHCHHINHQATFYTYNLHLNISLMVIVASTYLKFYIEVGPIVHFYLLWLHPKFLLTPTPQPWKVVSTSGKDVEC